MSNEEPKEIVRQLVAVLNDGDYAALAGLFAIDVVDHEPFPEQPPGLAGVRQTYEVLRAAFPDWQITIEKIITEDDYVTLHSTWHGTHNGPFLQIPPTDQPITATAIEIMRVDGGKIAERWGRVDVLSILQQLGVLPPMGLGGGSTQIA